MRFLLLLLFCFISFYFPSSFSPQILLFSFILIMPFLIFLFIEKLKNCAYDMKHTDNVYGALFLIFILFFRVYLRQNKTISPELTLWMIPMKISKQITLCCVQCSAPSDAFSVQPQHLNIRAIFLFSFCFEKCYFFIFWFGLSYTNRILCFPTITRSFTALS